MSFDDLMALNNKGVLLFDQHEFDAAAKYFRSALCLIRGSVARCEDLSNLGSNMKGVLPSDVCEDKGNEEDDLHEHDDPLPVGPTESTKNVAATIHAEENPRAIPSKYSFGSYVAYSKAFSLMEGHQCNPMACSLAVIFNLALTYHCLLYTSPSPRD